MNFQVLGVFTSASAFSCVCVITLFVASFQRSKYSRVDVVFYGSLILAISGISAAKIFED